MILIFINTFKSVFVETVLSTRSSIITGCIYRHPSKDICAFYDHCLNRLLEKFSKENDKKILIGKFNIDLLKLLIWTYK